MSGIGRQLVPQGLSIFGAIRVQSASILSKRMCSYVSAGSALY